MDFGSQRDFLPKIIPNAKITIGRLKTTATPGIAENGKRLGKAKNNMATPNARLPKA